MAGDGPNWEPLVTSLVLLATYLGQELWSIRRNSDHDRALFRMLLKDLPSGGKSMTFLNDHDIGSPFPSEWLSELDRFHESWVDAEHEFDNKKMNRQREKLLKSIKDFRSKLSVNVFSGGNGFLTMDLDGFEELPKKIEMRDCLNEMATQVFLNHQELIRIGRRIGLAS